MHKPQYCDLCKQPTELATSLDIYGVQVGGWDVYIRCTNPHCRAFVETMPATELAAGRMSSPAVRRARVEAHKVFDPLWQPDKSKRTRAYQWLQKKMGLTEAECHIRKFDERQCYRVIQLVKRFKPVIE